GLRAPVPALPGGFLRAGERGAEHDPIGPARDGFDEVAGVAHSAVGDDVDVAAAGFVEVVPAGGGDVGDGGGHRGVDAQGLAGRVRCAAAEAHEHARGAGAHEVQRGGVGRGAADDDGHVEFVDEPFEVERFGLGGDVFGGDGGAADDEQIHAGIDDRAPVLLGALRAEGTGDGHARLADLPQAFVDEFGDDRGG